MRARALEIASRKDPKSSTRGGTRRCAGALLVAAVVVLSAGCAAQPRRFPTIEVEGPQLWTEADLVDVAISDTDRSRVDGIAADTGRPGLTYATGPVWARLFIGQEGKSPQFTIHAAHLDTRIVALGFASRITYRADGILLWNDREYPIRAEGSRSTGGFSMTAESEAIQRGVMDAARKVRFIISGGLAAPATTPTDLTP